MINRCSHDFAKKSLIINNVNNRSEVAYYALKAIDDGILDNFYFSEDYIDEVFKAFSINKRSFILDGYNGYWYSVAPLTAAYMCSTQYLLYFMGDCIMSEKYKLDWIKHGIVELQKGDVFTVTPMWNYYNRATENFYSESELCYYDSGFSDQVFLVKTNNIASKIYNEYNVKSEIFPIYGGNHFERRVFCYINNHNLKRCVLKNVLYNHEKLMKSNYRSAIKTNAFKNEVKYVIAKVKKKIRKQNILIKYLLR